jgi:hypothetical protein
MCTTSVTKSGTSTKLMDLEDLDYVIQQTSHEACRRWGMPGFATGSSLAWPEAERLEA